VRRGKPKSWCELIGMRESCPRPEHLEVKVDLLAVVRDELEAHLFAQLAKEIGKEKGTHRS
jgi:hypothetical protein